MKYFAYQSYICIYTVVCIYILAKLSVIILIILEASIYDEGVLSEGFMSRRSLCPDGSYIMRGFCPRGFCPEGFLSQIYIA